ncbi:MAG: glycosyltransferase family 4 protein [Alphaproteobacteria bacterium]|uniref:Glycosyltransferase family 4 protein n=1 Tax=Candidatus Nitrobium versatile TaxID=2884831 RepID=A0A953M1V6_9BACT|nr:glycosyltransferase family 4 protein [Candidatus Nitrobium versatile]
MTADTVGGVWTYSLELACVLGSYGTEVFLATMGAPLTPAQREESSRVPGMKVFESSYRLEWMEDPWDDVREAGEWLLGLEEAVRPDIVHLNGYAHGGLPWRAPAVMVAHSCVLSWWCAVRGGEVPPVWERYRGEVARGLSAADCVVAPSEAMLTELFRHYPVPLSGRVVPNGRTAGLFAPERKEEMVLTVGRLWDEAKNAAALHRIAPSLSWAVYVAGEESHPAGGTFPGGTAVQRLGRLTTRELASWMARASIYALPAYYEPFGLSVLEAGLSGCALVLGDIPSLREIWDGVALFVQPRDEEALKGAIESLIRNPGERKRRAASARARAEEFSPLRMAEGYGAVYGEVMGKKTGKGRGKGKVTAEKRRKRK